MSDANGKPRRVLVAPGSFKGSVSAVEAAKAIARGVTRAAPDSVVDVCPLADGGEGTLDALVEATGGRVHTVSVSDSRGRRRDARWASLPNGVALIEAAEAVGLELVPKHERNPMKATSFGVGELIRAALDSGARSLVVALGGTATMDLGAGLAQALGVEFVGGTRPMTASHLEKLRHIDTAQIDTRLGTLVMTAAIDVDNPLLGPNGAATTYGPQKGATAEQIEVLERGFSHAARLLGDPAGEPGDGAAGGMAYMLRVVFGAGFESGARFVQRACSFESRLAGVDLVFTGEGRLDGQTARGKVACAVGRAAKARGVPVVALAGAVKDDARPLYEEGIDAWFSICDGPLAEREAMANAASLLEKAAENVARLRFR